LKSIIFPNKNNLLHCLLLSCIIQASPIQLQIPKMEVGRVSQHSPLRFRSRQSQALPEQHQRTTSCLLTKIITFMLLILQIYIYKLMVRSHAIKSCWRSRRRSESGHTLISRIKPSAPPSRTPSYRNQSNLPISSVSSLTDLSEGQGSTRDRSQLAIPQSLEGAGPLPPTDVSTTQQSSTLIRNRRSPASASRLSFETKLSYYLRYHSTLYTLALPL
jgi:hypothetical protein